MHSHNAVQLAQIVHSALARNALDEAELACKILADHAPNNANTFFLAGIIAYRRKRYTEAERHLYQAKQLAPQTPQISYWLGNVARAMTQLDTATAHYEETLTYSPRDADATYNLGLTLRERGDLAAAGLAFVKTARLRPADFEAHQRVVDCAAELALSEQHSPLLAAPKSGNVPFISFIICSITPSKLNALHVNLEDCLKGCSWELIHIDDARSLSEGYNRGIRAVRGEILVLCHDDIEILCEHFPDRLTDALNGADLVGIAGTLRVIGPSVMCTGAPYVHGWVTHLDQANGDFLPNIFSVDGPRIDGVHALDGLFFAARRHVFEELRFDEKTFDGFHFYDLDFSYRAHLAGLRVRIQSDLLITHASLGNFDDVYKYHADRFCEKYPSILKTPSTQNVGFFQSRLATREQVRCFYGWIGHWLEAAEPT